MPDMMTEPTLPCPVSPERARWILDNRLPFGELLFAFSRFAGSTHDEGITPGEDQYIRQVWKTMPGYTCYTDALILIAHNEHQLDEKDPHE